MNINNIYFKLEGFNPTGSTKDRIAKAMILNYILDGNKERKNKHTIVEATSGNTGISVAMVCSALGLRCLIYAPSNTSNLKLKMMQKYGTIPIITYKTISDCIDRAKKIGEDKHYHYLDQFNNKYNVKAQETMAQEIHDELTREYDNMYWGSEYFDPKYYQSLLPDAIVAGVGTGGTIMGLHKVFPDAKLFIIQVPDSEHIEGICDGVKLSLIPKKLRMATINVPYTQAYLTAKWLTEKHGIHCGISSGANYYAATVIQKMFDKILTVLPDSGVRYL